MSDKDREETVIAETEVILENLSAEASTLQVEAERIADKDESKRKYEEIASRLSSSEGKLEN